jgi:hypothetical protein
MIWKQCGLMSEGIYFLQYVELYQSIQGNCALGHFDALNIQMSSADP